MRLAELILRSHQSGDRYEPDAMLTIAKALIDISKKHPSAGVPCDMGEMCLDCQPRGLNGECPDAPQSASAPSAGVAPIGYVWPDMVQWLQESPLAQRGGVVNLHRTQEDPSMVPVYLAQSASEPAIEALREVMACKDIEDDPRHYNVRGEWIRRDEELRFHDRKHRAWIRVRALLAPADSTSKENAHG